MTTSTGTLLAASANEKSKSVEVERATKTLEEAKRALEYVMEDPLNGIPRSLIDKSEGIVILPGACKVTAGAFNPAGGRGIALIQNEDGSWRNPFFVTLREGNRGYQIGTNTSDIVFLFKDRSDILDIGEAEITLGGDVGIAAGPVNNGSYSNTGIAFGTEVYSYQRSNGVFEGISVNGGILSFYEKLSDSLYGIADIHMDEIFFEIETPYNNTVSELIIALNIYGE